MTHPFEADDNGKAELKTALTQIRTIVRGTLDGLGGKPGPTGNAPPYPFDATRLAGPDDHNFNGPDYNHGRDVYLSGGRNGGNFKMQATSGIGLSDIPLVMKYFGAAQPTETATEKSEHDPARKAVVESTKIATNQIIRVLGGIPSVASDALHRIANDAALTVNEQQKFTANPVEITGFLSALLLTIKMLQAPMEGVVKYRMSLMLRNNFVTLFGGIPSEQRDVLRAHPQVLVNQVIAASNAKPLFDRVQGVDPDTNLSANSPLVRVRPHTAEPQPHQDLVALTIGSWINGILAGRDYLTPNGLEAWLKSQGVGKKRRRELGGLMESFGSLPDLDRAPGQGRSLAVFENRFIAPKGAGGDLNIEEACNMAWNQFLFYQHIEESHDWDSPVGAYPEETLF